MGEEIAKRVPEPKELHDDALLRLSQYLSEKGFFVKANHLDWENGRPDSFGGVTPDIEATRYRKSYYFEIETCESLRDESATKSKLSVLSTDPGHQTYAVMFLNCRRGDKSFNGCRAFEKALLRWGLSGRIRLACYDTFNHRLFIDEEISPEKEAPII